MLSLWRWFERRAQPQETKREAERHAEFMALAGVVRYILNALPSEQQQHVRSRLSKLIANRMHELPVPPGWTRHNINDTGTDLVR